MDPKIVTCEPNELKLFSLNHALLVTDIHAALILASRDNDKRLAD